MSLPGAAARRLELADAPGLESLPPGSVIVDDDGDCAQQATRGSWWWMGSDESVTAAEIVRDAAWPLVIAWIPSRPDQLDEAYWAPPGSVEPPHQSPDSGTDRTSVPSAETAPTEQQVDTPTPPVPPAHAGSARRRGLGRTGWWWVLALCLAVGAAGGYVGASKLSEQEGTLEVPPAETTNATSPVREPAVRGVGLV